MKFGTHIGETPLLIMRRFYIIFNKDLRKNSDHSVGICKMPMSQLYAQYILETQDF